MMPYLKNGLSELKNNEFSIPPSTDMPILFFIRIVPIKRGAQLYKNSQKQLHFLSWMWRLWIPSEGAKCGLIKIEISFIFELQQAVFKIWHHWTPINWYDSISPHSYMAFLKGVKEKSTKKRTNMQTIRLSVRSFVWKLLFCLLNRAQLCVICYLNKQTHTLYIHLGCFWYHKLHTNEQRFALIACKKNAVASIALLQFRNFKQKPLFHPLTKDQFDHWSDENSEEPPKYMHWFACFFRLSQFHSGIIWVTIGTTATCIHKPTWKKNQPARETNIRTSTHIGHKWICKQLAKLRCVALSHWPFRCL